MPMIITPPNPKRDNKMCYSFHVVNSPLEKNVLTGAARLTLPAERKSKSADWFHWLVYAGKPGCRSFTCPPSQW